MSILHDHPELLPSLDTVLDYCAFIFGRCISKIDGHQTPLSAERYDAFISESLIEVVKIIHSGKINLDYYAAGEIPLVGGQKMPGKILYKHFLSTFKSLFREVKKGHQYEHYIPHTYGMDSSDYLELHFNHFFTKGPDLAVKMMNSPRSYLARLPEFNEESQAAIVLLLPKITAHLLAGKSPTLFDFHSGKPSSQERRDRILSHYYDVMQAMSKNTLSSKDIYEALELSSDEHLKLASRKGPSSNKAIFISEGSESSQAFH